MTFQYLLSSHGTNKKIILQLSNENETYTFITTLQTVSENWDKSKQRPLNIYIKKSKIINRKLDRMRVELSEYIKHKRKKNKPAKEGVMNKIIQEICSGEEDEFEQNTLLYHMKEYIDSKKNIICHSTYKRYKVFYHLMERYESFILKRLQIKTINASFISDFTNYGKTEDYSDNTIYRTIHFVKTILNFVEKKGIRTSVRELEIRKEKYESEIITLTEQDIMKIKNADVPDFLQTSKDWLLISCYTGQRFSDFINFTKNQLVKIENKKCITFKQQKTQKKITLPLHPEVLKILNRYQQNFPTKIDIQTYNQNIKEVGRISRLNNLLNTNKRIGFRLRQVYTEKWKVLSSHIGRRSFATNFYGKIPTALLMRATGHSTEKMFLRYINPFDSNKIISLGNYFDRIYENERNNLRSVV